MMAGPDPAGLGLTEEGESAGRSLHPARQDPGHRWPTARLPGTALTAVALDSSLQDREK